MIRVLATTDGKYIGMLIDETQPIIVEGVEFIPTYIQDLGNGYFRYSNSNYVADVYKES
jgi:hypothetical protein